MNQMNMHVPMNPVGANPNVGMQMSVPVNVMPVPSPQQMQPAMPQQPQQDKMDNISKVKTLMGSLRESLPVCIFIAFIVACKLLTLDIINRL